MLPMSRDFHSVLFPLLALLLGSAPLAARQQSNLTGRVSDAATGTPLPAANIRILNSSRGTITNSEGNFVLRLDPGAQTLVFSYLAYQPDTLVLKRDARTVDVRLEPSPIKLPEVF